MLLLEIIVSEYFRENIFYGEVLNYEYCSKELSWF